ncbi:MAG: hypothetical protein GKR94_27760 [Gammaproteobacteria bacterium]|nr:hypothetical protein [Gammaproteobacteria bacterium]
MARSLRRQDLRAKGAKRFKATTGSNHGRPEAEDALAQEFTAQKGRNRKWVGGITYLSTGEGWVYLAVILDLYSRQAVGCAVSVQRTSDGGVAPRSAHRRHRPY